jgi:DNA polymerase III delta prime subunit
MAMELHTTSGSFIFHGGNEPELISAAVEQARLANCMGGRPGECASCKQIAAGNYPDLIQVRAEAKPSINIEQVRGLISTLSMSLYRAGGRRFVVIEGAHLLTPEAQNALLKVLEEPPPDTIFILATSQPGSLLETVRSRCAAVHFAGSEPALIHGQLAQALELDAFERLLLAKRLADAKVDLAPEAAELHRAVAGAVRDGSIDAAAGSRRLQALELFRRQLAARVAPRVALERLMLEL